MNKFNNGIRSPFNYINLLVPKVSYRFNTRIKFCYVIKAIKVSLMRQSPSVTSNLGFYIFAIVLAQTSPSSFKNKNKRHVTKEANVPGAYFIFPIIKNVRKNKLNFLIIFNNRSYNLRCYSFPFSN